MAQLSGMKLVLLFILLFISGKLLAQPDMRIAVAANFAETAKLLTTQFENQSGKQVEVSSGSTGGLYAQIVHGAPYAVFLSADSLRPERLEQQGLITPGSRRDYATGQLALWSEHMPIVDGLKPIGGGAEQLKQALAKTQTLAIANPEIAPYGEAAKQALTHLKLWDNDNFRLVQGNNVLQAFQFKQTGNADSAIVAYHMLQSKPRYLIIPDNMYQPIKQQLVILRTAADKPLAEAFVAFLLSDTVQQQLVVLGYRRVDE